MTIQDQLQNLPGLRAADLPELGEEQHRQLLALIRATNDKQEHEYASALDHALALVPGVLRGTIRKMILG